MEYTNVAVIDCRLIYKIVKIISASKQSAFIFVFVNSTFQYLQKVVNPTHMNGNVCIIYIFISSLMQIPENRYFMHELNFCENVTESIKETTNPTDVKSFAITFD